MHNFDLLEQRLEKEAWSGEVSPIPYYDPFRKPILHELYPDNQTQPLDSSHYLFYYLNAQLSLIQNKLDTAEILFEKAKSKFPKASGNKSNLDYANILYWLAAIAWRKENNIELSWLNVKQGVDFLKNIKHKRNKDWINIHERLSLSFTELSLELYLRLPEKEQEALHAFDNALSIYPDHYGILLGYSYLLNKKDPFKALKILKWVIMLNPKDEVAYFNSGIILYDLAQRFAGDTTQEHPVEAADLYLESLTFFKKSHEINPQNGNSELAIKSIQQRLGLAD